MWCEGKNQQARQVTAGLSCGVVCGGVAVVSTIYDKRSRQEVSLTGHASTAATATTRSIGRTLMKNLERTYRDHHRRQKA